MKNKKLSFLIAGILFAGALFLISRKIKQAAEAFDEIFTEDNYGM